MPDNRGGHLLVLEGALILLGRVQEYVGQKPLQEVYCPGPQPTQFTLYVDDGDSLRYRYGAYAACTLFYTPTDDGFDLTLSDIEGDEPERIAQLQHRFEILSASSSTRVEAFDEELSSELNETRPCYITTAVSTGTTVQVRNL